MSEKRMTFGEHVEELRTRLLIAVLFYAAATIFSFVVARPWLFPLLKRPAPDGVQFISFDPTGNFGPYVQVALTAGAMLAMPMLILQVFLFMASGLKPAERRLLLLSIPAILAFFGGGVAFGYFVMLPPAMNFLLTYGSDDIARITPSISRYVGLVTVLLFWLGVVFETPLVIYILARIGLVTWRFLVHGLRYAVVGCFVLGAVITPTADPINQSIVAVPLFALYLLGIGLAWVAERQRQHARARVDVRQTTPLQKGAR